MAAAMGLGGAALAAGLGGGSIQEALAAGGGLPKKPYKFVFVNHVTTNPFFTPCQYGIQDACAWMGSTSQWTGSQNSVVSEMVSAMQGAIAAKVDGIAVALVDAKAFNKPTLDALSIGIPVIGYNADTPNARLSYVGQSLYQSGVNIATKWLSLVPKGGHVMLEIDTPGSLNLQPRLDGYIAAIKASGKGVTYDTVVGGPQGAGQLSAIESWYLSHKSNVAGMFGTGATGTLACGKVSKKYGLAAKGVITAGYDLLPDTLALIASGDLTFTTDQQPYLQGFVPILQMYMYKLSGGAVSPANTDTSLAYVTKANVHIYQGTPSRFEGSTTAEPK
jgi:simple sugar transport system substrate-binding protein